MMERHPCMKKTIRKNFTNPNTLDTGTGKTAHKKALIDLNMCGTKSLGRNTGPDSDLSGNPTAGTACRVSGKGSTWKEV